jgi:hypothetical protein
MSEETKEAVRGLRSALVDQGVAQDLGLPRNLPAEATVFCSHPRPLALYSLYLAGTRENPTALPTKMAGKKVYGSGGDDADAGAERHDSGTD